MHLRVLIHAVLTRATRSPKYSRGGCFLQGSIQRGETFTVLGFFSRLQAESTMPIATQTATPAYPLVMCFFFFLNAVTLTPTLCFTKTRKETKRVTLEGHWEKRKIFDSSPWRKWVLIAVTLHWWHKGNLQFVLNLFKWTSNSLCARRYTRTL